MESAVLAAQEGETGPTRGPTSDQNGAFRLVELPLGHYK